ncbi:MAG: hypothetical protein ABJA78_12760 [Ferruginibacter sp.]
MIRKFLSLIPVCALLFSCGSNKVQPPTTDTEVAQAFIRSTLDNNIDEAKKYILKDEQNTQLIETYGRLYVKQDKTKTDGYKKADIIINQIEPVVSDSLEIIYYTNSFDPKEKNKLKLVRVDGKWLIDFKYTLSGNL